MDNSYNATPTDYLWTFENGTPGTSTLKNPMIKFSKAGVYKVKLKVSTSSGSNEIEKTAVVTVLPTVSQTKAPFNQNFESFDATGYTFTQDSRGYKWTVANKAATSGSNSIWLNNSAGLAEESYMFTLPMVDMTSTTDYRLKFKMAFAQKSSASTDELRVQVSSTCGQNFNSVYYKFGTSLATTTTYYTSAFVPTAEQWREVVIDLSSYKSVKNLIVRFNLKNRGGNNIYVDDINLGGVSPNSGIIDGNAPGSGVSLYPNPANNQVNLSISGVPAASGQVEIFDMAGRQLQNISGVRLGDGAPVLQLDRHAMNISGKGIYMVKITLGNQAYVQKLVITE
jgi:PKD repeat protein